MNAPSTLHPSPCGTWSNGTRYTGGGGDEAPGVDATLGASLSNTHTHTHTQTHKHIHIHMHTNTLSLTHTYTHTYTHSLTLYVPPTVSHERGTPVPGATARGTRAAAAAGRLA